VATSTQNQVLSALLFLYREVLKLKLNAPDPSEKSLRIHPILGRSVWVNRNLLNPKEAIANGDDQQRPKDQGKPKNPNGLAIDGYDDFIWYFQVICPRIFL
jgi:hypothetical protein